MTRSKAARFGCRVCGRKLTIVQAGYSVPRWARTADTDTSPSMTPAIRERASKLIALAKIARRDHLVGLKGERDFCTQDCAVFYARAVTFTVRNLFTPGQLSTEHVLAFIDSVQETIQTSRR